MLLGVPLHPKYTYLWNHVSCNDLFLLKNNFLDSGKIVYNEKTKELLEKLAIPHKLDGNFIEFPPDHAYVLKYIFSSFKESKGEAGKLEKKTALEYLNERLRVKTKDKSPVFIGARVGRPEKAKERKLRPPVHCLFPVEGYGGPTRNILETCKEEWVEVELNTRKCSECGTITFSFTCERCGGKTKLVRYCENCETAVESKTCPKCRSETKYFKKYVFNTKRYLDKLMEKHDVTLRERKMLVKGVKKLMNKTRVPENLLKGILRANNEVYVFKDGTARFDAVDAPLTHFKPKEIGLTVEKARELGYDRDYLGNPLTNEEQVCELKVQDVIIPKSCARYFIRVANFIDELLVKGYGLNPYYNVKRIEELVGHLVMGISPHTFVAVLGRIIGFTDANVQYAHPFYHAAKRRNCDGDEDSLSLALDILLNFSRNYVPEKTGGLEDIPLLLVSRISIDNVDDEAYNMETNNFFPLEFYEKTQESPDPKDFLNDGIVETVEKYLKSPTIPSIGVQHKTNSISEGVLKSTYKNISSMAEKVVEQLNLAKKIAAVDEARQAELLINKHFIKDVMGNLRAYLSQKFRCAKCNKKYRRIPLSGKCECGASLILTVHKASVVKYVNLLTELSSDYTVPSYLSQRISLLKEELAILFPDEVGRKEKKRIEPEETQLGVQASLESFFFENP